MVIVIKSVIGGLSSVQSLADLTVRFQLLHNN